ncbi:MAG: phospholipase D-like domain-containing protein [Cellvibrionaceae bacterium]
MNPLSETNQLSHSADSERIFDQGDEYFDALIEAIDRAQFSVKLEIYIFEDDDVGRAVCQTLIRAANRGVDVRVIMDALGSYRSLDWVSRTLEREGVGVRVFHPLPWQLWHYPRSIKQGHALNKALYFLRKINRRDHRKLFVVDERVLFTGSYNLSKVHLPSSKGGDGWRDLGVRLVGDRAPIIGSQFDAVWRRQTDPVERKRVSHHYLANITDWARRRKNQKFESLIDTASDKVSLVSAYFAPSSRVVRALKRAMKRGVRIRIMVPARSDIHLFPFLTATYYRDLIGAGIELYEFQPSVLHAKLLICDEICVLGSTNFNHRSFLHDLELDIFLTHSESLNRLERFFEENLTQSIKIDHRASNTASRNWLLGIFSRLLRYWM